jgi:hypothetical protein
MGGESRPSRLKNIEHLPFILLKLGVNPHHHLPSIMNREHNDEKPYQTAEYKVYTSKL